MERSNNIMSLSPSPAKRLGVVEVASRWRRGGIGVRSMSGRCSGQGIEQAVEHGSRGREWCFLVRLCSDWCPVGVRSLSICHMSAV